MGPKILLIDDDPDVLELVEHHLGVEGMVTHCASTGQAGLEGFRTTAPAAVVLDLGLPDVSGKKLLEQFQEERPEVPIVVFTTRNQVGEVVECMRLGAVDYVDKPFDSTRLVTSIRNALAQGRLRAQVDTLARTLRREQGLASMLGESACMNRTRELLKRASASEVTVLLLGESGTGKEVAARAIHAESTRSRMPFVAINCGAIPEGLIESELFGHERGAFTGATVAREGKFEQAQGGAVFLDEIGELRTDLQVKLLRVLQERTVQRVGASKLREVDARVIAATNRDLKAEVKEGKFREDLYYRLAVFPIELPPLREREGDVLLMAARFLERFAARHKRPARSFSPEATRALEAFSWPGNVRELENVIERAVILEDDTVLSLGSLSDEVVCALDAPHPDVAQQEQASGGIVPLVDVERRIIKRALDLTGWNHKEAARQLGIGRATIYRKVERYGLSREAR